MSILSDGAIIDLCSGDSPMIHPFYRTQVRKQGKAVQVINNGVTYDKVVTETPIISMGLTSYGYDVSLAAEFKVFTNLHSRIIDPKRHDDRCLVAGTIHQDDDGSKYVILPPNSYLLGRTVEYLRIPRDVMVVCLGKSTYARAGAIVNVTPIEPGFEGHVVIEISNSTSLPLKVYAEEGISQFLFFKGDVPCLTSYADRGGKYMYQQGIEHAKV